MRPLLAVALLIGFTSAAPVPKELKKKDDAAIIVGRWIGAGLYHDSYEFYEDGTMKVWNVAGEPKAVPYRWTLDGTASPKRMTWYDPNSDPLQPARECVYELEEDVLKITYGAGPNIVPAAVGPGNGIAYCTTREAPAK